MTAAGITIREARADEYDRIADLTIVAYRATGDAKAADYEHELRSVAERAASCPILVAVDAGGRVVGSVTYVGGPGSPFAELERDGEAGFRMLAVAPEAQGRGVGRALAEAVVARARAEGRSGIAIYTRPSMTTAHALYGSIGFVRDPPRDWEFEPGEWLWALVLAL